MMKKKKQKKEKQESPPKNESDDKLASQSNEGQNLSAAENKSEIKAAAPGPAVLPADTLPQKSAAENKGETKAAPPSPAVLPADTLAKKQDALTDKTPKLVAENTNVTPQVNASVAKPEQTTVPQTSETKLLPTVALPELSKVKDKVAQASEVLADKLNGNQISETPQTILENAKKTNESTEAAKVSSTIQITELLSTKNEPVQQTPAEQLTTESKDKVNVGVNNNQVGAITATLTPAIPDILKIPTLDVKTDQPGQQPNKIHPITTSELENKKELPLKETKIPETKLADKTIKEQVKGASNKELTEIISTSLNEGTQNKTIINQNAKTETPQINTNTKTEPAQIDTNLKTESPQSNTNEKPLKEDSVAKNNSSDKKTGDKNKKPEESKSSEKPSAPAEKEDKDTKAKTGKNKPAKSKKPNSNSISETPSSEAEIQKPNSLAASTEAANPEKVLNAEKSPIVISSTESKTETKGGKESAKKAELTVGIQDKKPPEPKTNAVKTDKVNVKVEKLEKESKPSVPEAVISNEAPIADKATKPTSDQKLINENQKITTPDASTAITGSDGKEASKPSTAESPSSSKSKKKKQEKQNSAKTSESDAPISGEATKAKANAAKSEPAKGTTKAKPPTTEGNEAAASDKVNTIDKKNEVKPTVTESGEPKSVQNQAKQGKQKGKANDQNKVNTAQKDVSVVDTDITNKENTSPSNEPVTAETVKGKSGKKKNKKQKADQNSVDKDDKQEIKATGVESKQGQEASKEQNNSASPPKEGSKKSKRKGPKGNKTDAAQLENAEISNTDVLKDNKANIDSKKAKDPNNAKLNNQNLISENKQESDKGNLSEITGSQNEPVSELASGETAKKRRRRKRKKQNRGETQDGKSDVQANETKTDTPALKKKAE